MALKQIELLIGGEKRILKLGGMKMLQFAADIDKDPMILINTPKNGEESYRQILAIVYAGLKCGGNDITTDQVKEWCDDLSLIEAAKIKTTFFESMLGGNGQAGEAEARTLVQEA